VRERESPRARGGTAEKGDIMDRLRSIARSPRTEKFCFIWFAGRPLPGKSRAALVKEAKWSPGDVITVSFLDGAAALKDKVMNHAQQWTAPGLADLRFDFREDTTDTLIRISFEHPGSWSVIGTTCRHIKVTSQPTMNFGWLTESSPEEEIRRVVLHEFGHALGLIHEHQNPAGGIHWNKRQVYIDLSGPPNNWTKEQIDKNIFEPYRKAETNFTEMDPQSIMMYPIPPTWTTDGFTVGLNDDLSETDKRFIAEQYP
jgi:serralysin